VLEQVLRELESVAVCGRAADKDQAVKFEILQ
jgi:hypothetical protein